jgi:WD40 repeat protein
MDNHIAPATDLAFQPTQKQTPGILASAAEDRTIRLWQPNIGRLLRFARLDSIPRVIRWNPDGNRIWAGCDDGSLRVLDPESLKTIGTYPGKGERITGLALSPDGKKMVIASEKGLRMQDLKE